MSYFCAELEQLSCYLTKNRYDYVGYVILCDKSNFSPNEILISVSLHMLPLLQDKPQMQKAHRPLHGAHCLLPALLQASPLIRPASFSPSFPQFPVGNYLYSPKDVLLFPTSFSFSCCSFCLKIP